MKHQRATFPSAVHLFLIRDGHVLLLRRCNTGYEDGKLSVVAGHLDGSEEVKTAAIREAYEEIGVCISPDALQVVGVMHRMSSDERIDFFVTASRWTGEIHNTEPHKCSELIWTPLDRLPDDLIPYVRKALENFQRGVWFDSYGWDGESA